VPAIDQAIVQSYVDAGINAATAVERGHALEDLICYLFSLVPGIAITHRDVMNQFDTEEVDVSLFNDGVPEGFFFLPNVIPIEAKNWSNRVSSAEVSWFMRKIKDRGLDFGILVTTLGITGDATDLTNAHHIVSLELAERRRLIVITTDEIRALPDTGALILLLKKKLCDLHIRGTIG
jgi:hypothetical protein